MKSGKFIFFIGCSLWFISGCTKLDEKLGGNLTADQVSSDTSVASLMKGVYASLELPFTDFSEVFPLAEMSTDEAMVPTRGSNWDDNGSWRVYHQQKWDADNIHLHDCFNELSGVVFATTDILRYQASVQQKAEARFLRAWAMYWILDFYDQVPYREPGDNIVKPAAVRKGTEALDYIISEVNAVQADLPDGPPTLANKDAATVLLMKCFLNRGVYKNRSNPSFDVSDMNQVIGLADGLINSNHYAFSANYFDNFSPNNGTDGKENIFTMPSNSDGNYLVVLAWVAVLNYAQGGANGFTTLEDFYNKFEAADIRRGIAYSYPNAPPNPGKRVNVGFLIGQQYDLFSDDSLFSNTLPVNFTPEVTSVERGPNIEMPGIRPVKYPPDYLNFYGPTTNNFVYFRFPDVLLMKAEAILRGGTATTAGPYGNTPFAIVNAIRTDPSRGASALTSVDLDILLDERGRELWWENWRRQDMVRFGRFLKPFQEKEYDSDPKYLLFPIPNEQLAVNPNLVQNPGY